jgi:rare lipoprotein A (peptidoglycan hydrolase)
MALVVALALAGCSAPSVPYSTGYVHQHRATEVARSSAPARQHVSARRGEHVADVGGGSRGLASFYSGRSATGEAVGPDVLTAAHRTLPFGTKLRVTNLKNGRSVTVRINDRGPFVRNRAIDLSAGAAGALDMKRAGVAPVRMEVIR